LDDLSSNGADIGLSLAACRFISSFVHIKFLLHPALGEFFLCAKRQKGRLERNAKPLAHGIIPAATACLLGKPMILQLHLS
jgi:hypothetical protein